MPNTRSRLRAALLTLILTLLAGFGLVAPAQAFSAPTTTVLVAGVATAECGDTSGFRTDPLSQLPQEVTDTYKLIQSNGPFPYPEKDGTVFSNREGILPHCDGEYYHEYTVPTPGSPDRGARRIVTGEGGEYFYTADHYESFSVVDVRA